MDGTDHFRREVLSFTLSRLREQPSRQVEHPASSNDSTDIDKMPAESSKSNTSTKETETQPSASSRHSLETTSQQSEQSSSKSKSKMRTALSKAAQKLTPSSHSTKGSDTLASSEEEYAELKRRETEEQKRKEEYAKYGLGSKGFGKGSMQMGG